MLLAGIITCTFVGIICFLFGYLIWSKKQLSLIAGFDEKTYKGDKNKLAKTAGLFTIGVGILTILLPISLEFIGSFTGILYTIIIILGTIGVVIYLNLSRLKSQDS